MTILWLNRSKGQLTLIVDDQMISGDLADTDGILHNEGILWLGKYLLIIIHRRSNIFSIK